MRKSIETYKYTFAIKEVTLRKLVGTTIASKFNRPMWATICNFVDNTSGFVILEQPQVTITGQADESQISIKDEDVEFIHSAAKISSFNDAIMSFMESKRIPNERRLARVLFTDH